MYRELGEPPRTCMTPKPKSLGPNFHHIRNKNSIFFSLLQSIYLYLDWLACPYNDIGPSVGWTIPSKKSVFVSFNWRFVNISVLPSWLPILYLSAYHQWGKMFYLMFSKYLCVRYFDNKNMINEEVFEHTQTACTKVCNVQLVIWYIIHLFYHQSVIWFLKSGLFYRRSNCITLWVSWFM